MRYLEFIYNSYMYNIRISNPVHDTIRYDSTRIFPNLIVLVCWDCYMVDFLWQFSLLDYAMKCDATWSVRWNNQKENRMWIIKIIWEKKLKKKLNRRVITIGTSLFLIWKQFLDVVRLLRALCKSLDALLFFLNVYYPLSRPPENKQTFLCRWARPVPMLTNIPGMLCERMSALENVRKTIDVKM